MEAHIRKTCYYFITERDPMEAELHHLAALDRWDRYLPTVQGFTLSFCPGIWKFSCTCVIQCAPEITVEDILSNQTLITSMGILNLSTGKTGKIQGGQV